MLAARCLSRLGQLDQAEPLFQKAVPLDLEDQHIRAFGLVVNNRREPAILAYREILERRPDDVLALSRLAAVLISESRWDDVLEASERLIKIPAGTVIGHTLAGVVHHNTGDSELAVFAFSRVLELDPELKQMPLKPRSMFWTEFGHNLLEVGRWAEARRCLNRRRGGRRRQGRRPARPVLLSRRGFRRGRAMLAAGAAMGPGPLRHLVADRQARAPAGPAGRGDRAAPPAADAPAEGGGPALQPGPRLPPSRPERGVRSVHEQIKHLRDRARQPSPTAGRVTHRDRRYATLNELLEPVFHQSGRRRRPSNTFARDPAHVATR